MDFGGYCIESSLQCWVIAICSGIAGADVIRLTLQTIQRNFFRSRRFDSYASSSVVRRGSRLQEWYLIAGVVMLFSISVFQSYAWITRESQDRDSSIVLLQMTGTNLMNALLGGVAIATDTRQTRTVSQSTRMSFGVNLLANVVFVMVATRSQAEGLLLDSSNVYFYSTLAYLFTACLYQVLIMTSISSSPQQLLLYPEREDFSSFNEVNYAQRLAATAVDCSGGYFPQSVKSDGWMREPLLSLDNQQSPPSRGISNSNQGRNTPIHNNDVNRSPDQRSSGSSGGAQRSPLTSDRGNPTNDSHQPEEEDVEERKQDGCVGETAAAAAESEQLFSRIANVRIERFLETIKYEKKTIVFEVKSTYRGRMNTVKRSFREFGALNTAMKMKYKGQIKLPPFPTKKGQNAILTYNDLDERKKLLGVYLQEIIQLYSSTPDDNLLSFFTNDPSHTQNGGGQRQNKPRTASGCGISPPSGNMSMTEIIWEEDEELCHSASSSRPLKKQ